MASVGAMLRGESKNELIKKVSNIDWDGKDRYFEVIETIDPSFFDDRHNVLDLVVGRLYSSFVQQLDERGCLYQNDSDMRFKKNKLFDSFLRVKNCLAQFDKIGVSEEDEVDCLQGLESAVSLRKEMINLVDSYLAFVGKDVLILSIDDIDLQSQYAYKMVEQIRKYLVLNKVITLVALKLEQLQHVISEQLIYQNKGLLCKRMLLPDAISDMVAKYLIKLLPQGHRIFMPEMDIYAKSHLVLKYRDGNNVKESESLLIKTWITTLIYKKTGYVFIQERDDVSPIVSGNLREIRHLIYLLWSMPDLEEGNDVILQNNQSVFVHYFMDTWIVNSLDSKTSELLHELFAVKEVSLFNKTVLSCIKTFFGNNILMDILKEDVSKERNNLDVETEISYIMDVRNTAANISLGDVLTVVLFLKNRIVSKKDRLFIFAIETIYSIKLDEYYRRAKQDTEKYLTDFDRLIGGSYINIWPTKIMTPQQGSPSFSNRRDMRVVQVNKIKNYVSDFKYTQSTIFDEARYKVKELLCLLVSRKRYDNIKKGSDYYDIEYRRQDDYVYQSDLVDNDGDNIVQYEINQYVSVDLSSLLFNILSVGHLERAYNRIDEGFFENACGNHGSIMYYLLHILGAKGNEGASDQTLLMELDRYLNKCIVINNFEILEYVFGILCKNRRLKQGKMREYKRFFENIGNIKCNAKYCGIYSPDMLLDFGIISRVVEFCSDDVFGILDNELLSKGDALITIESIVSAIIYYLPERKNGKVWGKYRTREVINKAIEKCTEQEIGQKTKIMIIDGMTLPGYTQNQFEELLSGIGIHYVSGSD